MSDSFPVTLTRTQWHTIAGMLSAIGNPAVYALTAQVSDNLRKPRGGFDTRFRMLVAGDGELFLVPDGYESEFRKKDLDVEHLHDYYSWVATLEDLTFTNPVERP